MLILTAKMPRRKIFRGALLAAALCCALALFLTVDRGGASPASPRGSKTERTGWPIWRSGAGR